MYVRTGSLGSENYVTVSAAHFTRYFALLSVFQFLSHLWTWSPHHLRKESEIMMMKTVMIII